MNTSDSPLTWPQPGISRLENLDWKVLFRLEEFQVSIYHDTRLYCRAPSSPLLAGINHAIPNPSENLTMISAMLCFILEYLVCQGAGRPTRLFCGTASGAYPRLSLRSALRRTSQRQVLHLATKRTMKRNSFLLRLAFGCVVAASRRCSVCVSHCEARCSRSATRTGDR